MIELEIPLATLVILKQLQSDSCQVTPRYCQTEVGEKQAGWNIGLNLSVLSRIRAEEFAAHLLILFHAIKSTYVPDYSI